MSFSSEVKEELQEKVPEARHCQLAELCAFMLFGGEIESKGTEITLKITLENPGALRKCFTIIKKAFRIEKVHIASGSQTIEIEDQELVSRILMAVKWRDLDSFVRRPSADMRLLAESCCQKAFIRGCFLSGGSISTPEKFYHLEFVCHTQELAEQLKELLAGFGIDAKVLLRKTHYIVYLKESSQISDALKVMDAPKAMMRFENVLIMKDVRNYVNRSVNCEMANLEKTSNASVQQIAVINYLRDHGALGALPANLRETALKRLENPEMSLTELGKCMTPPVGKSGINHRLRKLAEIAERMQAQENEPEN